MSNPTRKRRHDWKPAFLDAFAKTGNVSEAAKTAGISRQHAYYARDSDPDYAKAWDDAEQQSHDALEREAFRRAHEGVKDFKVGPDGQFVEMRKYSDTLLIFLLKARRPGKYRENVTVEHTGKDGGPIVTEHRDKLSLRDALEQVQARRGQPVDVSSN
jgi:hypothetical protein